MDWFEKLMGFKEREYSDTRQRLALEGTLIRSSANGKSYDAGILELVSLQNLRDRVGEVDGAARRLKFSTAVGDVRKMHASQEYAGALFQVASQFNLLEMVGPDVTPEAGVGRYEQDGTQGPACAMAAGAATIYRNYFVPVQGATGQTRDRQLDGLAAIGNALGQALDIPRATLWSMRNGYAMCPRSSLDAISRHLENLDKESRDALKAELRIGVHSQVEVTDSSAPGQRVSQAFCSALPVAYGDVPAVYWELFARLILEAAYEATLWAGVLNARSGGSKIVLLTRLGGGAFGNAPLWIEDSIRIAVDKALQFDLDVRLISFDSAGSLFNPLP